MKKTNSKWIAFFSQTGSEIVSIAKHTGIWPDLIVTNERPNSLRKIHPDIKDSSRLVTIPNKPTLEELEEVLEYFTTPLITLHGWLRIMPPKICKKYTIYNGHPGLIAEYPELKGKDPQQKAFDLGLEYSGCVIHKVTEGVDEGEILRSRKVYIKELEIGELFHILHSISVSLWVDFLKN